MVEVLALGEEEGGDSPRTARPPLKRLLPHEQVALLPEQDTLDVAIVDLRAPLDRAIDPVQVVEALKRTRIALLGRAVDINDTRCCVDSMVREFSPRRVPRWPEKFVTLDATMAPQLWIQAGFRRSGHRRRIKAKQSAARAPALQAGAVEDTAPSVPAAVVGIGRTQLLRLGQEVRPASRLTLT
jgi:hypothetical protein